MACVWKYWPSARASSPASPTSSLRKRLLSANNDAWISYRPCPCISELSLLPSLPCQLKQSGQWAGAREPGPSTSYPWIATEAACDTVTVSYKRGHGGEAVQPVPRGLAGSLRSCFPWPLTDADACYRFLIFHKHKLAERLYASPRTLLQPPKLILFHRRGTAASLSTTLFPFSSSICIYTRTQQLSSSSLARPETPLSNSTPTRLGKTETCSHLAPDFAPRGDSRRV